MTSDDPSFLSKLGKRRYLGMCIEIYAEEEFLEFWMEPGDRSLRFVRQYGALPKHLPSEWSSFELEERVRAGHERKVSMEEVRRVLRNFYDLHPAYAHRG